MTHIISHEHLSLGRLKEIIENHERVELGPEAVAAIEKCRKYLDSKMEDIGRPVYGVTTGFGSLCNVTIPADQLSQLQHNLVMSHACGTGETVRPQIVRLMLLLKAQSLSYGHSGAQLITVQRLLAMFNNDILPVVYQQGSLGASGDLAPLAHLSLPLIGLGEVLYKGKVRPSKESLGRDGLETYQPSVQGGSRSSERNPVHERPRHLVAHPVPQAFRMGRQDRRDVPEAYDGRIKPFLPRPPASSAQGTDRHRGQIHDPAGWQRADQEPQGTCSGSIFIPLHPSGTRRGQGQHPLRRVVIENEINSATDNPNVFPDEDIIISAGNFHGEPIAIPMDALAIACPNLATSLKDEYTDLISGQRGLPKFLVATPDSTAAS